MTKIDFKNFRYNVDYSASCTTGAKQAAVAVAQKEATTDIMYLKNGTTVRGTIIENTPDKQVQIRVEGGDIVLYPAAEIDRIEKETGVE